MAVKAAAGRLCAIAGRPCGQFIDSEIIVAEIKRTRRNTLERRCLGKAFKRLFANSPKGVFKMLEKVKRA